MGLLLILALIVYTVVVCFIFSAVKKDDIRKIKNWVMAFGPAYIERIEDEDGYCYVFSEEFEKKFDEYVNKL